MSKDQDQEAISRASATDAGAAFAQRRKVIRGLASIPVALTLSNGARAANASSHQCLLNEEGPPPNCVTDAGDASPEWVYSADPADPTQVISVKPNEIAASFPRKYCVTYAEESGDPNGYSVTGFNYQYVDPSQPQPNRAIFIDQNGNRVNGGNIFGNPLRASCAGSFVGN